MRMLFYITYALIAYAIGLASLAWLALFLGNAVIPQTINGPAGALSTPASILANLGLLVLFGVHHSVCARRPVKAWLERIHPPGLLRSTYFLVSGVLMLAACLLWQPLPQDIWRLETDVARFAIFGIYWLGWAIFVFTMFLIDHAELAGLKHAWYAALRFTAPEPDFRTPLLYKLIRHPMMAGLVLVLWATPDMTLGRLLFAMVMTIYILIGLHYEERDLVAEFGDEYREYRRTTPKLLPQSVPRRLRENRRHDD